MVSKIGKNKASELDRLLRTTWGERLVLLTILIIFAFVIFILIPAFMILFMPVLMVWGIVYIISTSRAKAGGKKEDGV